MKKPLLHHNIVLNAFVVRWNRPQIQLLQCRLGSSYPNSSSNAPKCRILASVRVIGVARRY
jgi:hypothetical protein